MCWFQAYASFVPYKSSSGFGCNKKDRFRGLSAYHSSNYIVIRLPTTHSVDIFSAHNHATPNSYHSEALLANNIGGS